MSRDHIVIAWHMPLKQIDLYEWSPVCGPRSACWQDQCFTSLPCASIIRGLRRGVSEGPGGVQEGSRRGPGGVRWGSGGVQKGSWSILVSESSLGALLGPSWGFSWARLVALLGVPGSRLARAFRGPKGGFLWLLLPDTPSETLVGRSRSLFGPDRGPPGTPKIIEKP